MKLLFTVGTRPEAIKLAPVILEFQKQGHIVIVCSTGQHGLILDEVFEFFGIRENYKFNVLEPGQGLNSLTSKILLALDEVLLKEKPDLHFVHGDTTTTIAASLASFYQMVPLCHVEAGLRTYDITSPFPEEVNRQLTTKLSNYHFAPTEWARENLLKEGIHESKIVVTGNTVIDALLIGIERLEHYTSRFTEELENDIQKFKEMILITVHRRENHGENLERLIKAITDLSKLYPEICFYIPVHPNPNVRKPIFSAFENSENIKLIEPLTYPDFIFAMNKAKIIMSDSGGIQEEAPSLGKPVILLRDSTERPEGVNSGTVIMTGCNRDSIVHNVSKLIEDDKYYESVAQLQNPFGNGNAARIIHEAVASLKK